MKNIDQPVQVNLNLTNKPAIQQNFIFIFLVIILGIVVGFFYKFSPFFFYRLDISSASSSYKNKDYQTQLTKSEDALKYAGDNDSKAVAYYWKALAEYKLGDKTNAENDDNKALDLKSNYAAPYVTLSAIEADKGNFQKSLALAKKCAELDPSYGWCHNNIGIAMIELDHKEDGIKEIKKAISLDPENKVFQENLNSVNK